VWETPHTVLLPEKRALKNLQTLSQFTAAYRRTTPPTS